MPDLCTYPDCPDYGLVTFEGECYCGFHAWGLFHVNPERQYRLLSRRAERREPEPAYRAVRHSRGFVTFEPIG